MGNTASVWTDTPAFGEHEYARLDKSIEVDVVVVGAGITGASTAWCLTEAGKRVALIDAGRVAGSNTAGSTGNLYATVSDGLAKVREKWGDDASRAVVEARTRALDDIEHRVAELGIECGFSRKPLQCGVAGEDQQQHKLLEDEYRAMESAGLAPEWIDSTSSWPLPLHRALQIGHQAQFNPWLYTLGLVRALSERNALVFEHSRVVDLDASAGLVQTAEGQIRAQHIVLATHTPIGFNLVQAEMVVDREYGIAGALGAQPAPDGIFWVRDRSRSLRACTIHGEPGLVVVGEKHKTGELEPAVNYPERLRQTARDHFGVAQFTHQWSAQQYKSADALPYIGPSAHDNVHVATGIGADGLTWGVVAARVITECIAGRDTRIGDLLTPRRFSAGKSAKQWAKANAAVVKHMLGDRLTAVDSRNINDLAPGEGCLSEIDGHTIAVYRNDAGALSTLSPVCPHLKCQVAWNALARTWDCPCHGSRFAATGEVIEGPSLHPLTPVRIDASS